MAEMKRTTGPLAVAAPSRTAGVDTRLALEMLVFVVSKSKVRTVVNAETLHSVLESAAAEMWRGRAFRLQVAWDILTHEPGLTPQDVALPLLAFKTYEEALGIDVVLPEPIAAATHDEQLILRGALELGDHHVDEVRALIRERDTATQAAQQMSAVMKRASGEVALTTEDTGPVAASMSAPASVAPRGRPRPEASAAPRGRSRVVMGAIAAALLVGLGVSAYFAFREPDVPFDVTDVADVLKLDDARRLETTLAARISDPKWDSVDDNERRRIAGELFDREAPKGIDAITLRDASEAPRAMISNTAGIRTIQLF